MSIQEARISSVLGNVLDSRGILENSCFIFAVRFVNEKFIYLYLSTQVNFVLCLVSLTFSIIAFMPNALVFFHLGFLKYV